MVEVHLYVKNSTEMIELYLITYRVATTEYCKINADSYSYLIQAYVCGVDSCDDGVPG